MNLRKEIEELGNRVGTWRDLLKGASPRTWFGPLQEAVATVLEKDGEPFARAGFVARELLTELARASERLDVLESFYPAAQNWAEARRRELDPHSVLRDSFPGLLDTAFLFCARLAAEFQLLELKETLATELKDVFQLAERIRRVREDLAVMYLVRRVAGQASGDEVRLFKVMADSLLRVTPSIRQEFDGVAAEMTRQYLASERLYPWIHSRSDVPKHTAYQLLFNMSKWGYEGVMEDFERVIEPIMNDANVNHNLQPAVQRIFRRLGEVLQEVDYEEFCRAILDESGQSGPNSMIGNISPINVIPGDGQGRCHPILLALAQGLSRRGKAGLPMVLRAVRSHLIKCSGTRVVILLTDAWDPKVWQESADDLHAHEAHGVAVLVVLISGRRWSPVFV